MKKKASLIALLAVAGVSCALAQAQAAAPVRVKVTLLDHSHVLGTPQLTELALTTTFGEKRIPLNLVSTLVFDKGQAKLTLTSKDILTGTLDGAVLKLITSFGVQPIPYTQIASVTFAGPGAAFAPAGHEQGLLLHAPLDAPDASLAAFKATLETQNAITIDGPLGNKALLFETPDASASIDLPTSPYVMPEGTIEFWAKLPQPRRPFGDGRNQLLLFAVEQEQHQNFYPLILGFNANSGDGKGGLVGIIWGFPSAGTGGGLTVEDTGLLGDTPDGWHHYAFIWKWDGLEFPEAQGYVLSLAIDGKVVASTSEAPYSKDFEHLRLVEAAGRFLIHGGTKHDNRHPVAMSELKIWDHAKLPVVEMP